MTLFVIFCNRGLFVQRFYLKPFQLPPNSHISSYNRVFPQINSQFPIHDTFGGPISKLDKSKQLVNLGQL